MNLQELLNNWNIKCDVNTLLSMWNESHRHYHNLNHLNDIIGQINENKRNFTEKEYDKLLITALFHKAVFESGSTGDKEKSADFFLNCCLEKESKDIQEIKQMILNSSQTKLSESFSSFEFGIIEKNFEELTEWENLVSQEQKSDSNYKPKRILFLESALNKFPHNTENILKLIDFVKSK